MTAYLEHITAQGDRWDSLAWAYYGDPFGYERIMVANPDVPRTPALDSGIRLLIPVIEADELLSKELPPWKR